MEPQRGAASHRWALLPLVLVMLGGGAAGAASQGAPAAMIELDGDKVTARVGGAPLGAVMTELGRACGARVEWVGEKGDDRVATEFSGLRLADAVARLLRARSYVLMVDRRDDGTERLRRIVIMPAPSATARGARLDTPPAAADPTSAAGADGGGLDPAVAAVLADPEPAVRMQMLDSLSALDPDDPRRERVLASLVADPDPEVRRAAMRVSGIGAETASAGRSRAARSRVGEPPR